jgi:sulfatase maturation enzyme AslB (radical SAM superfamily)
MYFTGGEPLLNSEHWALLEELIASDQASGISLMYNTNLTTIKYKDKNIIDIWQQFKTVNIQCSIDAVGEPLEYIRSGTRWEKIKSNLDQLVSDSQNSNINIALSPVLSILNIWFIDELYKYASSKNIPINLIILTGPDYLALDVMPDSLKSLALSIIDKLESNYNIDNKTILHIKDLISLAKNQILFQEHQMVEVEMLLKLAFHL